MSQTDAFVQHGGSDGLLFQVEKFLALLVFHKAVEIVFRAEFDKMNFVGLFDAVVDDCPFVRSDAKQQAAIVFWNYRHGDVFEFVKDFFLPGDNVNELSDVDHASFIRSSG